MPRMRLEVPDEAAVDDVVVDADRLEDLGPLVALQGGDAHLAHHLEHALGDPLAIGGDDRLVGPFGLENAVFARLVERLEGQVRIDGVGSVADEQAMMVDLARFARFQHEADPRPLLRCGRGDDARPRTPRAC